MEVELTPDQKAFIKHAIKTGRFQHERDAVREALSLWEERERRRLEFLESLDDARSSITLGKGRVITEQSMCDLAEEVKERGRRRLTAE
ncbi:MAG TPA: type II toxin-antitoxin system ParD family antitoxin [Pyrinomonadaceae bacterium]|jgi:putative addiction module CopG family antidote